ncbi:serine hydrolase [Sphingobacterium sp. DK4209]|uniref:Serine hydrolase n=2 Tax=Sphingobacterium zhuxiongii TaxID=2662364 RepID=A0A5Q0QGJ8_9SPHI|nr:serine hydrolase [Sphingobacterium sp. DK4209]QGA28201.1 serine hydrolase [Sphingobacterium sp. dk4302]
MSSQLIAQSADFDQKLQAVANKYEAVGLAIVVVKDGAPVYNNAIGYKNLDTKAPLTTDNLFRIASISKSFSSTAIMQLVEKGKISLSDDFSDLVGFKVRNPKFPNTKITLEMVLSHRSSINDSNGYFELDVINPEKNANWAKSYNDYEPGKGYQYCNLNFNMVGAVLERLTNIRFDQYIKQQILSPIGLEAGYCVDSLDQSRFATLYDKQDGVFKAQTSAYNPRSEEIRNYKMGISTPVFSPTGGMKISANDLAKYMMMHMNYGQSGTTKIISKKSSKRMQKGLSSKENYGLALLENFKLIPGEHMIGHTGSAYGLYSNMFFEPKKKFGFIVITNGCVPTMDADDDILLSKEVIRLLYSEFVKK